jgi:PPM family protein phosphatase
VQIEYAGISHVGHRDENQDRVQIVVSDGAALVIVLDGMGGHSHGAAAAQAALDSLVESFQSLAHPLLDPLGFLHLALGRAHAAVVELGQALPLDHRPRATCAIALLQDDSLYAAHLGDSRIYHLRDAVLLYRTRDQSHVEHLLSEGLISEAEVYAHPLRNFVESCLGGDPILPQMRIQAPRRVGPGDLLLLCTDGVWSSLTDDELCAVWRDAPDLEHTLSGLCNLAVLRAAPHSDNTSAAVVRVGAPGKVS